MHDTRTHLEDAQLAIREVRTIENPAVHRLVASASVLADLVERISGERSLA